MPQVLIRTTHWLSVVLVAYFAGTAIVSSLLAGAWLFFGGSIVIAAAAMLLFPWRSEIGPDRIRLRLLLFPDREVRPDSANKVIVSRRWLFPGCLLRVEGRTVRIPRLAARQVAEYLHGAGFEVEYSP